VATSVVRRTVRGVNDTPIEKKEIESTTSDQVYSRAVKKRGKGRERNAKREAIRSSR